MAAVSTVVKAKRFTKPTCPASTTNVQVTRYAVEKVEVNTVINHYGFKHNCGRLFVSQSSANNSSSFNVKNSWKL